MTVSMHPLTQTLGMEIRGVDLSRELDDATFAAIPLRDGRLFSMSNTEMQVIGISFVTCLLVAWGSVHLLSIADKIENPRAYRIMRAGYGLVLAVACAVGAMWSMARVVSL